MFKFKIWLITLCFFIAFLLGYLLSEKKTYITSHFIDVGNESKVPVCVQTYYLIEKYSDEYEIPKYIAYNVAFLETKYRGPFDAQYNPFLTSNAGAVGAMQIMPSTANFINEKKINKDSLKYDLELNISTGMKLLDYLYKRYKDWGITCGYYNTGYPKINDYAKFCITNKDYVNNWIVN